MVKPFYGAVPVVGSAVVLAALLASAPVSAADKLTAYADSTYDTVVYGGVDFSRANSQQNGFGADAGFVTAVHGDISVSGWTVSANIGASQSNDVGTDTDSVYGSALVGYQWHSPQYYFALNAGVHAVDNDESPSGGSTDGSEVGAVFQYGFETKGGMYFVQSYGSFSTAYDQVYAHAKVGVRGSHFTYGAELTVFDEQDSDSTIRYGAFIGEIPLGNFRVGVAAGYQQEQDPASDDGFYATVQFSVPLSLR
ncbi:cellulose biosynthesis protein BcsS [Tepidamorphus sp. 3E244]|uniref:cellulose biosynthesis protein BcsS n=1 Tax=Tepidamorphus sp. 3E244 TaxID=3385498 RepID=UPI0038FC6992